MGEGSENGRNDVDDQGERARKACLTCRRQKMKCIMDSGPSCRRCRRMEVPCIFRPRANAAAVMQVPRDLASHRQSHGSRSSLILNDHGSLSVTERLDRIESMLGLQHSQIDDTPVPAAIEEAPESEPEDAALAPLWSAVSVLRSQASFGSDPSVWKHSTIKQLWQSFHITMPGLHFMPEKQVFTSPIPLLLAAILYCSSSRGPPEVAGYAPVYYQTLCAEIANLSLPASQLPKNGSNVAAKTEEWAFQSILGIILASLLSEGSHDTTGLWISMAYRIMIERCPPRLSRDSRQWQKVFTGLQILDLEHSSLNLICPSVPLETSLSAIRGPNDQLHALSRMMHVGLSHFAGRGLPTIWSYFSGAEYLPNTERQPFSGVDAAVIRDWARQLDEWLAHVSSGPGDPTLDRKTMYRQYVMHRLCVLSIYLPSRHYDLFSADATLQERQELLHSARVTIKLHADDTSIWSNWDMIMITWAALIVLQAIKGQYGEPNDLHAIQLHLYLLRQTSEPKPNLRHMLADRLEQEMQNIQEGELQSALLPLPDLDTVETGYPWALFDESSLEFVNQYF